MARNLLGRGRNLVRSWFAGQTAAGERPASRRPANRPRAAALGLERLEERTVFDAGWVDAIGGTTGTLSDLAGDAAGNTYGLGYFGNQSAKFDNITLTGNGVRSLFVAKANASGQYVWAAKAEVSSTNSVPWNIALDASGNAYITGWFAGTAQFGSQLLTTAGDNDSFVAKLNCTSGQFVWARQFGGPGDDRAYGVTVDSAGNPIVAGSTDPGHGTPVPYVSKRAAADGANLWTSVVAGGSTSGRFNALAVDESGAIYAGGKFQGTAEFPTGTLVSTASPAASPLSFIGSDGLLAKLDQNGQWQWARQLSGDGQTSIINRLTLGPQGQLYATGGFEGTINFDGAALASAGISDVFVSRFSAPTGGVEWAQRMGGSEFDLGGSLRVDPQGNVNVVGRFNGPVNFGSQTLISELSFSGGYQYDAFLSKLSPAGTFLESHRITAGKNGNAGVPSLHIDAAGSVYVGAPFSGNLQLPQQPIYSTSGASFVAKLPPSASTKFYVINDHVPVAGGPTPEDRTYQYAAGGSLTSDFFDLGIGITAPRGAASTAAGDKLWVLTADRMVYVHDTRGVVLGSWSAGSMPSNAAPQGITVTAAGDVYIVDSASDKVYKYAGAATRLSGTQTAASSFALDKNNKDATGIVTDGSSLWTVNSSGTNKVFKYNTSGTLLGKWGIDAANSSPTGITINPANVSDVWIVDNVARKIFQYTGAATRISGSQTASATYALAPGNTNPQDIADPPPAGSAEPLGNQGHQTLGTLQPETHHSQALVSLATDVALGQLLAAGDGTFGYAASTDAGSAGNGRATFGPSRLASPESVKLGSAEQLRPTTLASPAMATFDVPSPRPLATFNLPDIDEEPGDRPTARERVFAQAWLADQADQLGRPTFATI